MLQAYQHLGEVDVPKFTVIVAQKNHHTKLFQTGSPDNVPAGILLSDLCFDCFKHLSSYFDALSLSLQGQLWTQELCIQEIMISTCVLKQE